MAKLCKSSVCPALEIVGISSLTFRVCKSVEFANPLLGQDTTARVEVVAAKSEWFNLLLSFFGMNCG